MACPDCADGIRKAHEEEVLCRRLAEWREKHRLGGFTSVPTEAEWWREQLAAMQEDMDERALFRDELRAAWRGKPYPDLVRLALFSQPGGEDFVWFALDQ